MPAPDLPLEPEDLFFEDELDDFDPEDFFLPSSLIPATFAPATIAPATAPFKASDAAPLRTSVTGSATALTTPLTEVAAFFLAGAAFFAEAAAPFLAGADFALDFEPEPDDLPAVDDFEPPLLEALLEPEDLLDDEDFELEPEPVDLPAVDLLPVDLLVADALEAEPDDFPAVAVFEPVDLLAVAFDAEPLDFPADDFDVELPEDLLAPPEDLAVLPDFAAGFAVDLLAAAFEADFDELLDEEDDFDAALEPEDLLDEAALVGAAFLVDDEAARVGAVFLLAGEAALDVAVFLFVVVDFVELSDDFLVAIFFSLKCV